MQLQDFQQIGDELAIKWSDGAETFIPLRDLRRACPCAGCKGEVDVMGNLHRGPERPLTGKSFQLTEVRRVGGYALEPVWADGHNTGLFSFDFLKALGDGTIKVSCSSGENPHLDHPHDHGQGHHHPHPGHSCRCKGH